MSPDAPRLDRSPFNLANENLGLPHPVKTVGVGGGLLVCSLARSFNDNDRITPNLIANMD